LQGVTKIPNEIKYIAVIVIAVVVIWVGIQIAFGVINPFYVVASESMVPKLKVGDFVVINHNIQFDTLKIGDIIVFKEPVPDKGQEPETIVHRIRAIGIDSLDNKVVVTKGDANPDSIPGIDYPIMHDNYIGKVVYVIPQLGLVTRAISPPVNYILIAVILVILFVLMKKGKEKNKSSV
jgi:signal peptidase I